MSTPALVLEYIRVLAWPTVVIILTVRYHSQLSDFMGRVTKLSILGNNLEADVKRIATRLESQSQPPHSELPSQPIGASILGRVEHDPNLALAELRMELEHRLRAISKAGIATDAGKRPMQLASLIQELQRRQILSLDLAANLRDVVSIANRAVHGERVSQNAAENLVRLGIGLLEELGEIYQEKVSNPVNQFTISEEDRDRLMEDTRYNVTTVVPLVGKPLMNEYVMDQEALDEFLEGYNEYAEFLVKIEPIGANLPIVKE